MNQWSISAPAPKVTRTRKPCARRSRRSGSELGREYDLVIGGERVHTAEKIRSFNPARPSEIVAVHQKAGIEHVEPAMQAALTAFESWKNVAVEDTCGKCRWTRSAAARTAGSSIRPLTIRPAVSRTSTAETAAATRRAPPTGSTSGDGSPVGRLKIVSMTDRRLVIRNVSGYDSA